MSRAPLTSGELREQLNITYRQLDHWCNRGWLRPAGQGEGMGTRRRFPATEVAVAQRMVELVDEGLRVDVAADRARVEVEDAAVAS